MSRLSRPTAGPAVVVGAGAAGLTAAIFAARAGVPVVLLETRPKPGAKIRVSGGGRCNVLPSEVAVEDFHTSGSVKAMRNILLSWPLTEVRAFFEEDLGIPLKVEPTGKVFPRSDRSRDVVDALLGALRRSGAVLRAPWRVADIYRDEDGTFALTSAIGESLKTERLVLATGGLSLPKTGSDGLGLSLAEAFGHRLVPAYPALVPLLSQDRTWRELSGVSVRARILVEQDGRRVDDRRGDLLFTHRGFSGPLVLDVSRYVTDGGGETVLRVHWGAAVDDWDTQLRAPGKGTVGSTLRRHLPDRLAAKLAGRAAVETSTRRSELSRDARERLVAVLQRSVLAVDGSEGYATAEVTGGGVPLSEVVTGTLESRVAPGLFLCGEILDVTGRLGGYNFLWAWVTGRRVARALAASA